MDAESAMRILSPSRTEPASATSPCPARPLRSTSLRPPLLWPSVVCRLPLRPLRSTSLRPPLLRLPAALTALSEQSAATGAAIIGPSAAAPQPVVKSLPEEFTDTRHAAPAGLEMHQLPPKSCVSCRIFIVRRSRRRRVFASGARSRGIYTVIWRVAVLSSDRLSGRGVSWCGVEKEGVYHGVSARWRREIQRVNRMN